MLNRFYNARSISILKGKTITSIEGLYVGSNDVMITCSDGTKYRMYHQQDFSEEVSISYISCTGKYCATYSAEAPEQIKSIVYQTPISDACCQLHTHTSECTVMNGAVVEGDYIAMAKSTTMFTLETNIGKLLIMWKGVAYDLESSTEVDFIEITGCHAEDREYMGGATAAIAEGGNMIKPKCPYCGVEMKEIETLGHTFYWKCARCLAQSPHDPTRSDAAEVAMKRTEMSAVEYLKAEQRMCFDENVGKGNCLSCPLSSRINPARIYCGDYAREYPEKAVAIVEKWAQEHPERSEECSK